jgi:hypothetical protein
VKTPDLLRLLRAFVPYLDALVPRPLLDGALGRLSRAWHRRTGELVVISRPYRQRWRWHGERWYAASFSVPIQPAPPSAWDWASLDTACMAASKILERAWADEIA